MIFPDWEEALSAQTQTADLPEYTEWAMDWETGAFALRDGAPYTVTGADALRIWVRCALHPDSARFACSALSHSYGNELAGLLGENDGGILQSRVRACIREALTASPYIQSVDGFSFARTGSTLTVRFTVHSVYDDILEETEVSV